MVTLCIPMVTLCIPMVTLYTPMVTLGIPMVTLCIPMVTLCIPMVTLTHLWLQWCIPMEFQWLHCLSLFQMVNGPHGESGVVAQFLVTVERELECGLVTIQLRHCLVALAQGNQISLEIVGPLHVHVCLFFVSCFGGYSN